MNSKLTLALVIVAGVAGLWLWKGDDWAPKLGIRAAHPEPAKSETLATLEAIAPTEITRVEVDYPSGEPLVLERAGSTWKLAGNWPPRTLEVEELVHTLGSLRSRFHAIPLPDDSDLAQYGLATKQKPLVVKLQSDGKPITLTFGQPKPAEGDSAFTRPAYVRIDDTRELIRLGPDVMPIVGRAAEAYRRRAIFPDIERVKLAGGRAADPFSPPGAGDAPNMVTLPGADTASIRVSQSVPRIFNLDLSSAFDFTLARTGKLPEAAIFTKGGEPVVQPDRLADAWTLTAPTRDRVDPKLLSDLLSAVSNLWVDEFVTSAEAAFALDSRFAIAQLMPVPFEPPIALAIRSGPKLGFLNPLRDKVDVAERTGLVKSDRAISVTRKDAENVTVRIGGLANITEREEMITVPGGPPGAPPQKVPRKITTAYRFARVDGNPQVFIVNAEKLNDLFVPTSELVDTQVARFARDEVRSIVINPSGKPEMKLFLKKGDPKASRAEEKLDRWFIEAKPNPILADTGRVDELLDQVSNLSAAAPYRTQYPSTPPSAATSITIATRDKRPEGESEGTRREITLLLGKPDYLARRVPVRLEGWPRVTMAFNSAGPDDPDSWVSSLLFPNTITDLVARPSITYRSRKLFDSAAELTSLNVVNGFALRRSGDAWNLTAPVSTSADPGAASKLAAALAGLSATDYIAAAPNAAELKSFGLEKPAHAITLNFKGDHKYTLELGVPRPGKPEVFARLDDGAVFGLPNTIVEQLTTGVVGLLPLKVWATLPTEIQSLQITRPDARKESYSLARDGANWKLSGPFTAPVSPLRAQPLLSTLGNLSAVKYQALRASNAAEFGLDKPRLTLKLEFTELVPPPVNATRVTKTVVIGSLTPDGAGNYAQLDSPNAPVFVVPAAFVAAAQTAPLELLDRDLLNVDPARIEKVKVAAEKPNETFTLVKNSAGKWAAEGVTYDIDPVRIEMLTRDAARLPVTMLADYGDAVKWGDYGLDKPEATLTLTLGGATSELHTIAIGKADRFSSRYARVDDGKAVAVIPSAVAFALMGKRFDYADRTMLAFNPITLVSLVRKQGKDELELAPAAGIGWDIVKPAKQKADQPFVDELADALSKLRAARVAAYGKKDEVFKKYGLEPPFATYAVTVGDNAEQKTLRVGNPVDTAKPDGERYAVVDSQNPEVIVGVLPAALVKKLLAPAVAFRDRILARFVDADKAVLERGDRKITFAKVGVNWKVTEPLAAAAEAADLEVLIADLGKLRAETWLAAKGKDLKPFGLDKPEAKWTLSYGDKAVLVLLIGKKTADGRIHVATDTGELVGLLDPVMSVRVLAEYRQRKPWDADAAQIQSIEIGAAGGKFTIEKSGMMWIDPAKPTEPVDIRVVNELLGTLGAIRVERYAADTGADLKLFGLEKPEFTLTVHSGNANHVLAIGGTVGGTGGKQRYARVIEKDRSDVFVLSEADTTRLTRNRAAYVLKK